MTRLTAAFAIAALAGLMATLAPRPADAAGACLSMPLRFADTSAEGCPDRARIDGLMEAKLAIGAPDPRTGEPEGVTLTNPNDDADKRTVQTCSDYVRARQAGWFAMTQKDMNAEGFMRVACGTLLALRDSAKTDSSRFESDNVGPKTLSLLPVSVLSGLSPDIEDRLAQLEADGMNVGALVGMGEVLTRSSGDGQLELAFANTASTYGEVARGDFNGDGWQDVLVYARHEAVNGTMRWYDLFALGFPDGATAFTRFTPEGMAPLAE